MSEEAPAALGSCEKSLTKTEEWLSAFSKDAYAAYSKVDSINDRVRTLTPPMTALGVGLVFEASRYHYRDSSIDVLFFYMPLGLGLISTIVAIFLILWALTVKHEIMVLPGADTVRKAVLLGVENNAVDSKELEVHAIERRCCAAEWNASKLNERGKLLYYGAWLAIWAFASLLIATPKFVHNQITYKTNTANEQR